MDWDEEIQGCYAEQEDDGFNIRPIQLGADVEEEPQEPAELFDNPNINHWMDQGFHIGMVQAADSADVYFRCCFNCLKEWLWWWECTKLPLLPELQEILNREVLNQRADAGGKGGCAPPRRKGLAGRPTKDHLSKTPSKETLTKHFLLLLEPGCAVPLGRAWEAWWALVDRNHTWVLLETGARVNSVTPGYVSWHKLKVGSIVAMDHSMNLISPLVRVGGKAQALGYVLIWVQVEGVPIMNKIK